MKSRLFITALLIVLFINTVQSQSWNERPILEMKTMYEQDFTTKQWDGTIFYNHWNAIQASIFSASDIENGYLQYKWIEKRILQSKEVYSSPYILEATINYEGGSNRGGIVIRTETNPGEKVQEPAQGDPGFNSEGIAFYPTDDGDSLIVQLSGVYVKNNTPVIRIKVPKLEGIESLKGINTFRIEDYGTYIYVFINNNPFFIIGLAELDGTNYTSGSVYNSAMEVMGAFTGMEVKENGQIAICQRNASLKLYKTTIKTNTLKSQTISFNTIGNKTNNASPFKLSAIASSVLPVTFSIVSGPATIVDDVIQLTGKNGKVSVMATQSGNDEYLPAYVSQTFYVTESNISSESQDFVDNWVATDALGRKLPQYAEVGPKREGKLVGVFYYIWNGAHGNKVYDITKILKNYPSAPLSDANTAWGPKNNFHFWGEPECGYYHSADPWVLRRDLHMLSNAKVDFVFFDVTNGPTYLDVVKAFCEMSMQLRTEGVNTPQITFATNKNPNTVNKLYDEFYSQKLYEELWFKWDGKPLILGLVSDPAIKPEAKAFFTWKFSWAWTNTVNEPNHWQWLDKFPQDYGWSTSPKNPEQISVSVAHHPGNPLGKSYHDGQQPQVNENYLTNFTGQGLQFEEQWKRALQVDPQVIMITQWNEWIAQRFSWDNVNKMQYAGRPIKIGETHFVDVFTAEFNRDIAPMKGGYSDNYYYQMVANIRKFKGISTPQTYSAAKNINIDGQFDEWLDVSPVFKDPIGDTMHRNFKGYDPTTTFVNNTGRNDIVESRVIYNADSLFFYVKTSDNITTYTDPNWMLLFIDVDKNKETGWEGYDYLINHAVNSANETEIKQFKNNEWVKIGTANYALNLNQMEISVSRETLGIAGVSPEFYFHWADNPQHLNDISDFFTEGESAPDRRFNFSYSPGKSATSKANSLGSQQMLIFPSPANYVLNIQLPLADSEKAKVFIFNTSGRLVVTDEITGTRSSITTEQLNAGLYLVWVLYNEKISTGKFIKN